MKNYYLITPLGRTLLPADTWEEAQVEGEKLRQALGLNDLEILVIGLPPHGGSPAQEEE